MADLTFRTLTRDELPRLREIDRSEVIEEVYYLRGGSLIREKEFYDMKDFPPGEREKILVRLGDLHDRGGTIFGAFDGPALVGITAVESRFIGSRRDTLQMTVLFVSAAYRRAGVGRRLVELAKEKARHTGAAKLYISATPSRNTVDFYLGLGCALASEVDPQLFELEPEDIHLVLVYP